MNEVLIQLNNISIRQTTGVVISDLSLTVNKGEFVYLLGKTGSGKSSVLKCLYAEIGIVSGTAMVAGFELSTLTNKEIPFLRRKLGIVFQDFQLLTDRNIFENLRFVMKSTGWKDEEQIKKQVLAVLDQCGLTGKYRNMPYEISG
ncbi:MAG TPA: ATP-binding cassette domain-containing protein, partial [Bacteroidia bacterium]